MCSGVWAAAAAAGGSERADLAGGRRAARRRPRASPSPPRLPAQMRISPLVPARVSAVRFLVASHCEMDAAMFRDAVCGPYKILASALTVERHYDDRIKRLLVGVLSVSNVGLRALQLTARVGLSHLDVGTGIVAVFIAAILNAYYCMIRVNHPTSTSVSYQPIRN